MLYVDRAISSLVAFILELFSLYSHLGSFVSPFSFQAFCLNLILLFTGLLLAMSNYFHSIHFS